MSHSLTMSNSPACSQQIQKVRQPTAHPWTGQIAVEWTLYKLKWHLLNTSVNTWGHFCCHINPVYWSACTHTILSRLISKSPSSWYWTDEYGNKPNGNEPCVGGTWPACDPVPLSHQTLAVCRGLCWPVPPVRCKLYSLQSKLISCVANREYWLCFWLQVKATYVLLSCTIKHFLRKVLVIQLVTLGMLLRYIHCVCGDRTPSWHAGTIVHIQKHCPKNNRDVEWYTPG